jgi:hypothetical protein
MGTPQVQISTSSKVEDVHGVASSNARRSLVYFMSAVLRVPIPEDIASAIVAVHVLPVASADLHLTMSRWTAAKIVPGVLLWLSVNGRSLDEDSASQALRASNEAFRWIFPGHDVSASRKPSAFLSVTATGLSLRVRR